MVVDLQVHTKQRDLQFYIYTPIIPFTRLPEGLSAKLGPETSETQDSQPAPLTASSTDEHVLHVQKEEETTEVDVMSLNLVKVIHIHKVPCAPSSTMALITAGRRLSSKRRCYY